MKLAFDEITALWPELSHRSRLLGGPEWLCHQLVATLDAREKLRAWIDDGAPQADVHELLCRVRAHGELEMTFHIIEVLLAIPPCVARYVCQSVVFLTVGDKTLGWCGPAPVVHAEQFLIALSYPKTTARLRNVIAHEVAHAWLFPTPTGAKPLLSAVEEHAFMTAVRGSLCSDSADTSQPSKALQTIARAEIKNERQARSLVEAWGFEHLGKEW